jgi:hypothetical protein
MTTIENSASVRTAPAKSNWIRRTVMGTALAAVAVLTLGANTTPAQAYWYGGYWYPNYYWYHPYYAYYPHYYWYHPYYFHAGWGWGWRGGWGWHRHW